MNKKSKNNSKDVVIRKGHKLQKLTGRLVFQFDDEAPVNIANVYDRKPIYLTFSQEDDNTMTFEGADGKKLKIMILDE